MFISVVLPAPFSPSRPRISPGATPRSTSSLAWTRAEALGDAAHFDEGGGQGQGVLDRNGGTSTLDRLDALGTSAADIREGEEMRPSTWHPSSPWRTRERAEPLTLPEAAMRGRRRGFERAAQDRPLSPRPACPRRRRRGNCLRGFRPSCFSTSSLTSAGSVFVELVVGRESRSRPWPCARNRHSPAR